MIELKPSLAKEQSSFSRPRLGFVGAGWIGRYRMTAVAQSGLADVAMVCDPAIQSTQPTAFQDVPWASTFEEMLESDLDGVVIATPNSLHARQTIAALQAGKAVFCQKPLARTAAETREILSVAR